MIKTEGKSPLLIKQSWNDIPRDFHPNQYDERQLSRLTLNSRQIGFMSVGPSQEIWEYAIVFLTREEDRFLITQDS